MAKYDFDLQPDPDRTFVNSKTYGEHTRARRGTKSKVEVNDTLKAHNVLLTSANIPAILVKKAIDNYRSDFPSGQLWQFLVGMFKRQLKMNIPLNVDQLMYKDISTNYRLSRVLKSGYKQEITSNPAIVNVEFGILNPEFRSKAIDGFLIEVIAMFFDFNSMESTSDSSSGPIVPLKHEQELSFDLKAGKPGDSYLICLKLNGCIRDEILTDNSARCMQIIQTGMVSENGLEKVRLY